MVSIFIDDLFQCIALVRLRSCAVYIESQVSSFKSVSGFVKFHRFSKFLHAGKRMKFATKPVRRCPSHLRHVATLPWEIKNSSFIHPQVLTFAVFKIASLSLY